MRAWLDANPAPSRTENNQTLITGQLARQRPGMVGWSSVNIKHLTIHDMTVGLKKLINVPFYYRVLHLK